MDQTPPDTHGISDDLPAVPKPRNRKADRLDRERAALRANLTRRKGQARDRAGAMSAAEPKED